eukprot:Gb_03845 [translate_table: standard]
MSNDSEKAQSEWRPPLVKSNSINDLSNLSDLKNLGRKEPKQGGCLDVVNGEMDITSLNVRGDLGSLDPFKISEREQQKKFDKDRQRSDGTGIPKVCDVEQRSDKNQAHQSHQAHSGLRMLDHVHSLRNVEKEQDNERDKNGRIWEDPFKKDVRKEHIFSGPLLLPNRASANSLSAPIRSSGGFKDHQEDRSKASLVQKKGRFSVTSEDVALVEDIPLSSISRRTSQSLALRKSASVGDWLSEQKQVANAQLPKDPISTTVPVAVLAPYLQNLLQQTICQQDHIVNLLTSLPKNDASNPAQQSGKWSSPIRDGGNDVLVETTTEREQILLTKIAELQSKILSLTDELHAVKLKSLQLTRQLSAVCNREEEERIRKEKREKEDT